MWQPDANAGHWTQELGDGRDTGHAGWIRRQGHRAGGPETTEAGDRLDDVGSARENSIGGDALQHVLLAGGDAGLEGVHGCGGARGGLRIEFGAELAEGAELVEKLVAES